MQLRQIGELKLLEEIRRRFNVPAQQGDSGIIIGIGDDAAAIAPPKEKVLVTADMMHEGVHFDLSYTAPFHLGFKLVSVNVSDIMAMGGTPRYLFLTLSMKGDTDETFLREFYDGIAFASGRYGVALLGGDLSAARNDMVLSATVIGTAGKIVTRTGAAPGDGIYVTSATGDAACGLELLKRLAPESREAVKQWKKDADALPDMVMTYGEGFVKLDGSRIKPLLARHLMPVARDVRELLPCITSMIDISDGLFMDLCRICDESRVGARVYLERIPVSESARFAAAKMGLSPLELAASGGEDYELLFTVPPEAAAMPGLVHAFCIGEITAKERVAVDRSGRESALKTEGYQHFGITG
ncbi:MAG: thiamine-phosphate kinase [Nitrospirae bacterium]|nr:thiamine-phosphate kinase [Nitrospirota bacterium]